VWLPITFPGSTSMSLNWYPTITLHSGKGLDVASSSTADGANGTNQQWSRTVS
jgi:hypothetical protein